MSGERVELLKFRSKRFLDVGVELLRREVLDLAAFNVQQSCQLRVKATLLRLLGEIPRVHSVRELLGTLSAKLEEAGFRNVSSTVKDFTRTYRDFLFNIDSVYTMSRYSFFTYTASDVEEMVQTCLELHKLLDEVERYVLG